MKIAIPVASKSMDVQVNKMFGRTPYYLFYDTETSTSTYVDNAAESSQGGAGIKASQLIVDNKADALITFQCGQNAAEVIKAANIEIYKAISGTVSENIESFNEGDLQLLDEIHSGFHNHGGR